MAVQIAEISFIFTAPKATHKTEGASLLQRSNMSIDVGYTDVSAPAERYVVNEYIALRWSAIASAMVFYRHSTPLECWIFLGVP